MAGGRKAAAVGYSSTLFTMPSGVAGPVRPPCTPSHTAHFYNSEIKRGRGWRRPRASDPAPGL